jgi:hypothetical protein
MWAILMKRIFILICVALIFLASITNLFVTTGVETFEEMDNSKLFVNLKATRFDPLVKSPDISSDLIYLKENDYYLVQCMGPIQSEWFDKILNNGARILGYVPEYTYIINMEPEVKKDIEKLPFIRWIGIYHPAYKIEQNLLTIKGLIQLNIMVFQGSNDPENFKIVREQIMTLGGTIIREEIDSNLIITEIEASKISEIAFLPKVQWIDEYSSPKALMDNIRVFTGASSPLHETGFNGTGIVGEVKDSGLDLDHPEFEGQLLDTDGNVDEDSHGTSTFGIVFAKGVVDRAKGMLPGAQGVFATWGVGRKQSIANLVNNWGGVFQSNSWSSGSSDSSYSSVSRQNDEAVFEYNVTMLYATGNGGSESSITQDATAKNVIGVGAFNHYNNLIRTDDRHTGNQGNRGPTQDGRIKPDVVGPYDSIYTTTSGDRYTSGFGGTSGATPVAAGAVGLIYEMYRENHFGNNPSGKMPHAATVKALLIADAYQYEFSQGNRFAQGWGLIDAGNVYNMGKNHLIDDENNAVRTGESVSYKIIPTTATPLKISLVWTDVPGTISSAKHLINDLNLKVTDPKGGIYHGNYGLNTSKWSNGGGETDDLNNVENVFIENPMSGEWTIEVIGENIPLDGERDTPRADQSYALVASGVTKYEHDLRVQSLGYPEFVGIDENVQINATILNIGSNLETNVRVELLVDNITVDTNDINSIDIGESIKIKFFWVPKEEKKYYITVSIEPQPGETSIWDNKRSEIISANTIVGRILVDNGHGTDPNHNLFFYNIEVMGPERYRVLHTSQSISTELLDLFDVFITARPTQRYSLNEISSIEDFVDNGGGLLVIGKDDQIIYDDLTDYAGINWGSPYVLPMGGVTSEINQHEITQNVNSLYFNSPELPLDISAPAEEIVYTYGGILYDRLTVSAAEYGNGRLVAIADEECLNNQFINEADNFIFSENIIRWLNNERPISIIDSPSNNSEFLMNDSIRFDGSSSYDPDGDLLTYLWSSNISGEIGNSKTFYSTLTPGRHTITLTVRDNAGKSELTRIMVTVLNPPTVEIRSPDGGSHLNGIIEISGTATDADGVVEKVEILIDNEIWQNVTDSSTLGDWSAWKFKWDTEKVFDGDHTISVRSLDNDGLISIFHAVTVVIDNTPPNIIKGPEVSEITPTEATIYWETNEPSNGMIEFGVDSVYDFSESDSSFIKQHNFVLDDLQPKTTYHFRVISEDILGNPPTVSDDLTFETAPPPDYTPPKITITSPEHFDILAGDVIITADVSDDYGIAKVEFLIENNLKFIDTTPNYIWSWDTTNGDYPDGQYSIRIIATDLNDNTAEDEITVILDNEIIPPLIIRKLAIPNSITSGEYNEVLLLVEVDDPENRLEFVTVDLSSIGGSSSQTMYDTGRHGDNEAGDNTYSFQTAVPPEVIEGRKLIKVIITYSNGNTIETSINLDVLPPTAEEESEVLWDALDFLNRQSSIFWLATFVVIIIIGIFISVYLLTRRRRGPSNAYEVVPLD